METLKERLNRKPTKLNESAIKLEDGKITTLTNKTTKDKFWYLVIMFVLALVITGGDNPVDDPNPVMDLLSYWFGSFFTYLFVFMVFAGLGYILVKVANSQWMNKDFPEDEEF